MVRSPSDASELVSGRRLRFRCFTIGPGWSQPDPADYLRGLDATVDLTNPDCELTLVRGRKDYLAVTTPGAMMQGWSLRRPRSRPFFHPSAIFPKLSRALVNLTRCMKGDVFLEPFAGTGSIAIEASMVGANVVALDMAEAMARGALSNMIHFAQQWMGVVRADSARLPIRKASASATDIPYGRASSTRGRTPAEILDLVLPELGGAMEPGSFLVLVRPQGQALPESDFDLEEEHILHVHKLLTRTIAVLKRR